MSATNYPSTFHFCHILAGYIHRTKPRNPKRVRKEAAKHGMNDEVPIHSRRQYQGGVYRKYPLLSISKGHDTLAQNSFERYYPMKTGIHPNYLEKTTITCGCGASISVGSTRSEMNIDVCANCHPFYTGKKKRIDSTGRVDRFEKLSKKAETLRTGTRSKREKLAEKSRKKAEKTATPSPEKR